MSDTNEQLKIELSKDGKLIISIDTDLLCNAIFGRIEDFRIVNQHEFIKDLIQELESEEEDGTTLVHRMFDKAADSAIENGSENVEEKR